MDIFEGTATHDPNEDSIHLRGTATMSTGDIRDINRTIYKRDLGMFKNTKWNEILRLIYNMEY